MATDVFNYDGKNPDGNDLRISIDMMLPGSGFILVENTQETTASGYIAAADIIAMAEAILWAFRDNFDEEKKPQKLRTEIVRETWDRNVS